jgi:head-tail adaptor
MLAAGLLTNKITIRKLTRIRDAFGSEIAQWDDAFTARCHVVVPTLADRRQMLNDEVFVGDRLTFQCRKYVCKYLALEYRVIYRCREYKILKIDDEGKDLFILAELINT